MDRPPGETKASGEVLATNEEQQTDEQLDDEAAASADSASNTAKWKAIWAETMFAVIIGHNIPHSLELLMVILEDIQNITYVFPMSRNALPHGFPLSMKRTISLSNQGFETYAEFIKNACLVFGGILAWFLIGAFIMVSTHRGKYYTAPLFVFRLMSYVFPRLMFVPIVEILFGALDCAYRTDRRLLTVTGETVYCSTTALLPFLAAVASTIVYIPLSLFLTLCLVNPDPTYKKPSSKVHSRAEAIYALFKVLLSWSKRALPEIPGLGIVATMVASASVFALFDYYQPHYNLSVNYLRCAIFMSIFVFAGLVGVFQLANVQNTALATGVIVPLAFLTFPLTYMLCRSRFRRRVSAIPNRLAELEKLQGWEKDNYLVFDNPPTVELSCRFITEEMKGERLRGWDASKADLVYAIFDRGVKEFPKTTYLHLLYHLYSSFMRSARNGWVYPIARAKELSPAIDMAFFIYLTETLAAKQQQIRHLGCGSAKLDILRFAEYKKLRQLARQNHNCANQDLRLFWRILGRPKIDKEAARGTVIDLFKAIERADDAYRRLLALFPESHALNRSYASFLLHLKNEKETAEKYIQQADMLEERAAACGQRDLGFGNDQGSDAADSPVMTNDTPKPSSGPRPLQDPPNEGNTSTAFKPGTAEVVKTTRAAAASIRSSGSATTGALEKRITIANNMRRPANSMVRLLNVESALISVIAIVIQSVTYVFMLEMLTHEAEDHTYRQYLQDSRFLVARIFQTLRRMILAAANNDTEEYIFQKDRLNKSSSTFRNVSRLAYINRPTSMAELEAIWTEQSLPQITRTYPENVTFVEFAALYGYTESFVNKAAVLLDQDMVKFADPQVVRESEVRFVFDNFRTLDGALSTAEGILHEHVESSASLNLAQLWSGTAVTFVVIFFGIFHLVERLSVKMENYQTERLDLLSRIPKEVRSVIRDSFESAGDDVAQGYVSDLNAKTRQTTTRREFRLRGFFVVAIVCAASVGFESVGRNALMQLDVLSEIVEPFGEIRTAVFELDTLVTELTILDTPETWPNYSAIQDFYLDRLNSFQTMISLITHSAATGGAITDYPADLVSLWFDKLCLSYDVQACTNTSYDPDVDFTPNAVFNGLGSSALNYLDAAISVAVTAASGSLNASYPQGQFMMKVDRTHLIDGFQRALDLATAMIDGHVAYSKPLVTVVYACGLLCLLLAYMVVFRAVKMSFNGKDRAMTAMFLALPKKAVKSDPVLDKYCRTGEMAADASDRSGAGDFWKFMRAGGKRGAKDDGDHDRQKADTRKFERKIVD